eukprot:1979961-Prorocentrum_lima.AAC.1
MAHYARIGQHTQNISRHDNTCINMPSPSASSGMYLDEPEEEYYLWELPSQYYRTDNWHMHVKQLCT